VQEFDEALKAHANSFFVVDYSTTWCGPCKLALPKFVALSDKYPSVKFFKVGKLNKYEYNYDFECNYSC